MFELIAGHCDFSCAGGRRQGRHFRQSEIQNLGVPTIGDENIGGLDVAMNDAFCVRRIQSVGHFKPGFENLLQRERAPHDQMLEGAALQILHGDEHASIVPGDLINRADIRMIEGRGSAGLAPESLQ
jgi:hypothetical protein